MMPATEEAIMTVPIIVGARTTSLFFTDEQLAAIEEAVGFERFGMVYMITSDHVLGMVPKQHIGQVLTKMQTTTAQITRAEPGDPAPWRVWFSWRPPDVALGKHYLGFHFGHYSLVALIPSMSEVLAMSPERQ